MSPEGTGRSASTIAGSAAASCFGPVHTHGLVGFSDAGYLVTKLLRNCSLRRRLPGVAWMMTIGSATVHARLKAAPISKLANHGGFVATNGLLNADVLEFLRRCGAAPPPA